MQQATPVSTAVPANTRNKKMATADSNDLGLLGMILTAATLAVVALAIFIVQGHLTGRYVLDQPAAALAVSAAPR
jgi:hypothetical protein